MNLPGPLFWAGLAGAIGLIGLVAALYAWNSVSSASKRLSKARNRLVPNESWVGAYPADELSLETWMKGHQISPDSHLGDLIRTSWSSYQSGRTTSLSELHTLATRRERTRLPARLSGGIATLLLVFGIVGTLSSIHPILSEFKIGTSQEGFGEEVAQSTARVNSLVNELGNAFWPSLTALALTIVVVFCRGLYSLSLHRLVLALDRFATGILLPRYRVPPLAEQLSDLKSGLTTASEEISKREEGFGKVVEKLDELIVGISPIIKTLEQAATKSEQAARKLSARSNSIADGLTRHLGQKSPIYQAISKFDSIFPRTENALEELSKSVTKISGEHKSGQESLQSSITTLENALTHLPAQASAANQSAIKEALESIRKDFESTKQKILFEQNQVAAELSKQAEASRKAISGGEKALSAQIEIIEQCVAKADAAEELAVGLINKEVASATAALKSALKELETHISEAGAIAGRAASDELNAATKALQKRFSEAGAAAAESAQSHLQHSKEQLEAASQDLRESLKVIRTGGPVAPGHSAREAQLRTEFPKRTESHQMPPTPETSAAPTEPASEKDGKRKGAISRFLRFGRK